MPEWSGWISADKKYPAPDEGLHPAVCVDVSDFFEEETQWGKKFKFYIWWQLDLLNPETQRRFLVRKKFTASLHEKSKLRPFLEAWRGKKFVNNDEVNKFNKESLIGANCQLAIVHFIKNDKGVGYDVQAVVPARPTDPKLHPQDYVRLKDRPTEKNTGGNSETTPTEPF